MLRPELIPTILIALPLGYTALMWHLCRVRNVFIPPRLYWVFVIVFGAQCLMYLLFHFVPIPIEVRGFWVRVSIIDIALSFSIPLTILYQRARIKP